MDKSSLLMYSILGFTLINLLIGLLSKHKALGSWNDYIAAPDQTGLFLLVSSLSGTIVGGGMFFAVSQIGYEAGTAGFYLGASYLAGFSALGYLVPKIRRELSKYNSYSIYEYLETKYDENIAFSSANIFRFACLFLYTMFIGGQFIVLTTLLQYLFPEFEFIFLVLGASSIFLVNSITYMYFGGIRKDILTDVWQMLLVCIGLVAIFFSIDFSVYDLKQLDGAMLVGTNKGIVLLIGLAFFTGPSLLLRPDMWQRVRTAKTDKEASKAFYIAGGLSFLFFGLFTLLGMFASLNKSTSSELFLLSILDDSSNFIYLTIILAVLGAVLSSADTFINTASYSISELVNSLRKVHSKSLRQLQIASVLVVILAMVMAISYEDLINLFASGFGVLFIFFPTVFYALFSSKPNGNSSQISCFLGLIVYLITVPFLPTEAFLVGFFVSIISFFIAKKINNVKY